MDGEGVCGHFRWCVVQYAVFYPKTEKYVGVFSPADDDKSKKQYVENQTPLLS